MSSASIKEVARVAGVSIATVSRVINEPDRVREKTREKVQSAIRETGYAPNTLARNFRRGKTNLIMVVLPSVGDPFFTDLMDGIQRTADEQGYAILINETRFGSMSEDEIGAMIVSRQVDGIILLASMSPFGTEVLSARSNTALPIVVGCEAVSDDLTALPSVHIDNIKAAREATEYLIDLGHRRIAFISGEATSMLTRDREDGYRSAMTDAGIDIPDGYVLPGDLTVDGGSRASADLMNHLVPPTAIFCANDEMAIGTMHGVRQAGLSVPRDVSVIGFDDTRYAAVMNPPLTTITQPAKAIGAETVNRLIRAIEGRQEGNPLATLLPHTLIKRGSVSAI